MASEVKWNDEEIEFREHDVVVARFEDSGSGMEGSISEGHLLAELGGMPVGLSASDLIILARWLLSKAEERVGKLDQS